jgi:hypothetical protein
MMRGVQSVMSKPRFWVGTLQGCTKNCAGKFDLQIRFSSFLLGPMWPTY